MFPFTKKEIERHLKEDPNITDDEREFYEAMLTNGEAGILAVLEKHRQRDLKEIEKLFGHQPK